VASRKSCNIHSLLAGLPTSAELSQDELTNDPRRLSAGALLGTRPAAEPTESRERNGLGLRASAVPASCSASASRSSRIRAYATFEWCTLVPASSSIGRRNSEAASLGSRLPSSFLRKL